MRQVASLTLLLMTISAAVFTQQPQLALVAVGTARQQDLIVGRQRVRVRRGHRADQEPGDVAAVLREQPGDRVRAGRRRLSVEASTPRAARACRDAGAIAVHAAATHAVFSPAVGATLGPAPVDEIVIADSIPARDPIDPALACKLVRLSTAPMLAEAIRRLHEDRSLVELTER